MPHVLIIDDDPFLCDLMQSILERGGFAVDASLSIGEGIALAESGDYDLVFLDVVLPDGDGLERLGEFLAAPGSPLVVVMTSAGKAESAEQALLKGAWDYICKPLSVQDVSKTANSALAYRERQLKLASDNQRAVSSILGSSHKVRECVSTLLKVAPTSANCLIIGETGTGKELFARAIHDSSQRNGHNFVVVDCTNIPETLAESILFGHSKGSFTGAGDSKEGLFRQADKGTLFLDEIGDLPLKTQKSLLRVLQEKRFRPIGFKAEVSSDFRLIAATNRNLQEMVEQGLFRSDLYYRLSSVLLHLPPLRERGDDVALLVTHFISKLSEEQGIPQKEITPSVMEALTSYPWPGNIRELINAIITTLTNAVDHPSLELYHLPIGIRIHLKKTSLNEDRPEPPVERRHRDVAMARPVSAPAPEFDPEPEPEPEPSPEPEPEQSPAMPSFKDARRNVVDAFEQEYFNELVACVDGDPAKACKVSGLSRARIYQLLRKHGLNLR